MSAPDDAAYRTAPGWKCCRCKAVSVLARRRCIECRRPRCESCKPWAPKRRRPRRAPPPPPPVPVLGLGKILEDAARKSFEKVEDQDLGIAGFACFALWKAIGFELERRLAERLRKGVEL